MRDLKDPVIKGVIKGIIKGIIKLSIKGKDDRVTLAVEYVEKFILTL